MIKRKKMKPTEGELEILQVLWEKGPATVREVNDELNKQKNTGYTTTLKIMQIMTEKSLLKRDESNRSHVYRAVVDESKTQAHLLENFLETAFKGSASKLMMHLLGNKKTGPEEMKKIREYLDKIDKNKKP